MATAVMSPRRPCMRVPAESGVVLAFMGCSDGDGVAVDDNGDVIVVAFSLTGEGCSQGRG